MITQTNSDVRQSVEETFQCPLCGVQYSHELLVRTHIALCDDDDHACYNGFMPEDTVDVLNDTGAVVESRPGNGSQNALSISLDDLPDGLSEIDKHIITTAVKSTEVDTYQELVDRINSSLRAEGLQKRSYTTIVERLKDFFELNTTTDVEFEDLSTKQQRVLELYAEDSEMNLTELAEKADVDPSYPNHVIEKYGHTVDDSSLNQDTCSKSASVDEDSRQTPDKLLGSAAESDVYPEESITATKKQIVEYIARNPNATNRTVAEAVECSISYPSRVRDQFHELILSRAEELGVDLREFDDSINRRQQKRPDSWFGLTEKQRAVMRHLSQEDDPLNPDASLRDIVENLPFDTYPTYISDVKEKYGEYALRLKRAREQADSYEEAESMVDEIDLNNNEDNNRQISDSDNLPVEVVDMDAEFDNQPRQLTAGQYVKLCKFLELNKQVAQSELKHDEGNQLAAGRLVMIEQFESKLEALVEESDSELLEARA